MIPQNVRNGVFGNPTSLAPGRDVSGVKALRYKGSGAWKAILVSGRFETLAEAAVAYPGHRGHAPDRDLESSVGLKPKLRRIPLAVLPSGLEVQVK